MSSGLFKMLPTKYNPVGWGYTRPSRTELISSTISQLLWQRLSFWSSVSLLGTNFAQIFRIFSSSRMIVCTVPTLTSNCALIVSGQSTLMYWLPYSSHTSHHPSQTLCLPWISYATQKMMLDSCKMLQKQSEAFHEFLWHFSKFKTEFYCISFF